MPREALYTLPALGDVTWVRVRKDKLRATLSQALLADLARKEPTLSGDLNVQGRRC